MSVRTIEELLPAFATELEELTVAAGRVDLVDQIRRLPVLGRCRCGGAHCAHSYTAREPDGPYGAGHECLLLPAIRGLIVYDIVDGKIVAVEVLDRVAVRTVLDQYFGTGMRG